MYCTCRVGQCDAYDGNTQPLSQSCVARLDSGGSFTPDGCHDSSCDIVL